MPRAPSARKAALAANNGKPVKKVARPAPAAEEEENDDDERSVGARRAVPCLACVSSVLAGRGSGACFDQVNPGRSKRCVGCAKGHSCQPCPAHVVRAATELTELKLADASKRALARARKVVRELLASPAPEPAELVPEREPSAAGSEELGEDEDEPEDDDEDELEDDDAVAARRAERKKALKKGLCALVDLLFE